MLPRTNQGGKVPSTSRLAWVFTTRESVCRGIGQALLEGSAVFRETLEACDRYVDSRLGWSLLGEIGRPANEFRLHSSEEHMECALTAVQIGLVDVLRAAGVVKPDIIFSRCGGMFAAAYASGGIDRDAAMELACRSSAMIGKRVGLGKMISVRLDREQAQRFATECSVPVWLLSDSGLQVTLIGCRTEDYQQVVVSLHSQGIQFAKRLSEFCYHSPLVDGWVHEFMRPLAGVASCGPSVQMVSSLDGRPVGDIVLDSEFFWREVRESTWLVDSLRTALERGCTRFLVVGPNDTVSALIQEVAGPRFGDEIKSYPTALRDQPGVPVLRRTLDQLRDAGCVTEGAGGKVTET